MADRRRRRRNPPAVEPLAVIGLDRDVRVRDAGRQRERTAGEVQQRVQQRADGTSSYDLKHRHRRRFRLDPDARATTSVVTATSRAMASPTAERDSARSTSARSWSSVASPASSIRTRTSSGPAAGVADAEHAAAVRHALHGHAEVAELDARSRRLDRDDRRVARRERGAHQPAGRGRGGAAAERGRHVGAHLAAGPCHAEPEPVHPDGGRRRVGPGSGFGVLGEVVGCGLEGTADRLHPGISS